MQDPEPDSTPPVAAGPMPTARGAPRGLHRRWCQFHVPDDFGGTVHISGLGQWRPTYQHEVALLSWARHVTYPAPSEETPVAVVCIDNADQPGEIAMSADDLVACAERLLGLRDLLLSPRVPEPRRPIYDKPGEPQSGQDPWTPMPP